MDLPVHSLVSDQGVPIYFEQYPQIFTPVSFMLCMMSGSADDDVVGVPGIHHWGEHIPFRGTVSRPKGASQIMGRAAEMGGHVSAYTSHYQTVYYMSAPRKSWREAAETVVDLAARPLCRPEDIEAEREIIGEEINQGHSSVDRRMFAQIRRALWEGHPLGRNIIGTHESLAAARTETILEMRSKSYSNSRCLIFVAGALEESEVQQYVSELLERMPNNTISERRRTARYGELPAWKAGVPDTVESGLDTTVVSLVFPEAPLDLDEMAYDARTWASYLIASGSLAGPLYRVVREERKLAYSTSPFQLRGRDGGAYGFTAKTSKGKVPAVVDAFKAVLALPELRSEERWELVRKTRIAQIEMQIPDPSDAVSRMLSGISERGSVASISAAQKRIMSVPHDKVLRSLNQLVSEEGRVITLLGKK